MEIAILGGGIGGLTTAIALNKIGLQSTIYEAASEIKAVGAGISLAGNAIKAFQKLKIDQEIIIEGRLLERFFIKDETGETITQTKSLTANYSDANNFTIHRANLHRVLMGFLDPGQIVTNQCGVDFEHKGEKILLYFSDGSSKSVDYLIASDGIHSAIRSKLLPNSKPRFAGYTCWRAVIDTLNLDLKETSETWGPKGRFGIVPLTHGKLYWFACIKAKENDERLKNFTIDDLKNIFQDYHKPIPEILEQTKDKNLIWNDIMDIVPIKHYAFKNILLLGDAAHATTPNMGQGACQAIEDAVILADELEKAKSIQEGFIAFENRRIKRTHYIINQSRTVGKVAQMQNKFTSGIRNFIFRSLPDSIQQQQIQKVLKVDF